MSRVERSTDQQLNAVLAVRNRDRASISRFATAPRQLQAGAAISCERTNGRPALQAKQQAEAASSLKSSVLVSVTHDLLAAG